MSELTKHVSQDDMTLYSGPGNIHSDLDVARRTGLDATIAQGMQTLAFASELLTRELGDVWLERGALAVKFVAPVYADDDVTVSYEDGIVEARNQRGEVVMAGTATLRSEASP